MKAIHIILASALITTGVIKAAPALAEPAAPARSTSASSAPPTSTSRSDAGQRQLDQRLAIAAREVCGTASDADLEGKNEVRQCRDDVLAKARAKGEQSRRRRRGGSIAVTAAR